MIRFEWFSYRSKVSDENLNFFICMIHQQAVHLLYVIKCHCMRFYLIVYPNDCSPLKSVIILIIIIIVITLNFEKGKKEIPFLPISPLSRSISSSTSENISRNRFEGNVICIRVCTKLWKSFVPTKPSLGSVCSWNSELGWLGLFARAAGATRLFKEFDFPVLIVRRGTGACFGRRRRGGLPWKKVRTRCPRRPSRYPNRVGTRRRRIPQFKFRGHDNFWSIHPSLHADSGHVDSDVDERLRKRNAPFPPRNIVRNAYTFPIFLPSFLPFFFFK